MKLTKYKVIRIIIFFIVLIGLIILCQRYMHQRIEKDTEVLDTGWNISINQESYQDIALSQFKVPQLRPGDTFMLSRELEETDFIQPELRVYSRYSAIKVYLEQEMIYSDEQEEYKKGEVLGNGYHWITLPADYSGKTISIVLSIGEVNSFTSVDPIMIMNAKGTYFELVCDHFLTGVIAICIIAIGVISIFFCVATGFHDLRFQMLLWLGLFSIFIGIWQVSSTRIIEIFCQNLQLICYLEYIGMYGAAASMLFYVAAFFPDKAQKKLFLILAFGFLGLSFLFIVLNESGVRHFPKTVLIFHAYALLSSMVVIFTLLRETKKKKRAEQVFLVGIVSLACCVVIELIRYRYNKMCIPAHMITQSIIPLGLLIFILFIFSSYFYRMMERVAEEMERKTLYEMAYQDSLTGIKNRAWCEKIMQEFEKKSKPITIINMDLNYFKQVNDTLGHAVGDELLSRFADILASIFRGSDCVGRMGGDEFIVILDYIEDGVVEEHMRRLFQKVDVENSKQEYEYQISVSYGYASDATVMTTTPWKIYEEADRRMYQYKKETKKQ